jgi:hypothetical protein
MFLDNLHEDSVITGIIKCMLFSVYKFYLKVFLIVLGLDVLSVNRSNPEEFIHIFVKNTPKLIEFLEFMIETREEDCTPEVHNTLLELYLQSYKNEIKEDVSVLSHLSFICIS